LIPAIVFLPDDNLLSFNILILIDIKCLLVVDIDEVFSSSPEDLPPIGVGAGDFHFLVGTISSNMPRVTSPVSRLDSQGRLMEPEGLSLSSISGLDHESSVWKKIKISVSAQSGNNMEISFNVQTESLVEFTLSWVSLPLILIGDIPLLRNMGLFVLSVDVSLLSINITLYPHDLSSFVGKIGTLHFEHLPPS
jgi:hypothetical protein